MALPELLDALRQQAAEARAADVARADAEVERIHAEARASLEHRRLEYVGRTRRQEEEAARRAVSRAEKAAAESVLVARDHLLGRVETAVATRVDGALGNPEYLVAVADELRQGLERLPPGPVVVRAPPELIGIARAALAGRDGVTLEESSDIGTGFTAYAGRSGVEVDGTLQTRLRHTWPQVAVSVLGEVVP